MNGPVHPLLWLDGAAEPACSQGVMASAPAQSPRLQDTSSQRGNLASPSADPNDLVAQGWGIIAPKGEVGDRLCALVKDLTQLRREQGTTPVEYRVDPGMEAEQAESWIQNDYWDRVGRDAQRLPRYLLLLGDADGVSFELQMALARHGAFPGRLSCAKGADYEAYANKVIRWERRSVPARKAVYYAAADGTTATLSGIENLLAPNLRQVGGRHGAEDVSFAPLYASRRVLSPDDLEKELAVMLGHAASPEAAGGLLFSVTHGLGLPGSASLTDRRARQGAMHVHPGKVFNAEDVRGRAFFPGGVWVYCACFGAGTPSVSAYHEFLRRAGDRLRVGNLDAVLEALPKGGDPPFVAALPQAALAAPEGPLGVVGHVDLAWTWSYSAPVLAGERTIYRRRREPFDGLVDALLRGRRFGPAVFELSSSSTSLALELATMYGKDEISRATEDPARAIQRAYLWLRHNDAGAYILLGDPAASLPQVTRDAARTAALPAAVAPVAAPSAVEEAMRPIQAYLGTNDLAKVARLYRLSPDELKRRAELYDRAGREALALYLAGRPNSTPEPKPGD